MSKAWGKAGAWADEADQAEAEEREAAAAVAASPSFPSLKEAVSAKPKKKKMTLSEFNMGGYSATGGAATDYANDRLTPDEMLRLPTGPKERTPEEMQHGRLGGGFSSYGRSARPMRDRDDTWGGGNRRPYGGFDDEQQQSRGQPSRVSNFEQPSRADEVDNWAKAKKSFQSVPSQDPGRHNRYGGLGSGVGGFSRADEVDNWTTGKKPIQTRTSTFGSGFRDSDPEPDRWTRGGGFRDERSRLNLNPPKADLGVNEPVVVKTNKPNPFGEARPREQVLAEKGLDWKKMEMEIESKKATSSRPSSSHSSRPSSGQSSRSESQGPQGLESVGRPYRPKVNPFGDAKPREVLLEERGQDWRKIDLHLEHRRIERPETEEEKILQEEIDHLKKELQKESAMKSDGESMQSGLHNIILQKEQELEMLIRDLDDKVRFRLKSAERPGSGADRAAGFPERPPSQSGSSDESRSVEFMDRPHSRGRGDVWTRHVDDRRGFQGGRERGFLGNRNTDRQRSRERW
ncbi:eukaryotic translation initiation factor 4B2-like [Mangifera indica]|uniref:eukaryotic translation initiation factor 4B2-like n=1 Tax=Mangifera indica TaxID=29780 RepID=UPI001CFB07AC|nr:eukaryotic translation initiation factor 4B2-like [Mangifera indica]